MVMTGKCAALAMVALGLAGCGSAGKTPWPLRRLVLRCWSMPPAACARC